MDELRKLVCKPKWWNRRKPNPIREYHHKALVVNTIIVIPYKQISLLMIEKILLLELEVLIFAPGNFIKNMRLVSLFNECAE
jgi:hypothetical protein